LLFLCYPDSLIAAEYLTAFLAIATSESVDWTAEKVNFGSAGGEAPPFPELLTFSK